MAFRKYFAVYNGGKMVFRKIYRGGVIRLEVRVIALGGRWKVLFLYFLMEMDRPEFSIFSILAEFSRLQMQFVFDSTWFTYYSMGAGHSFVYCWIVIFVFHKTGMEYELLKNLHHGLHKIIWYLIMYDLDHGVKLFNI